MRCALPALALLLCAALLVSCTGEASDQEKPGAKKVGGCLSDTIMLGIPDRPDCPGGASHVRISILSVEQDGEDFYRTAAAGLLSLLDSLEVAACGRICLTVNRSGPCWPRYRVEIRLDKDSAKRLPDVRGALAEFPLVGLLPSTERPSNYGDFFVQAAVGSSDSWTLWYSGD
jgi:hypothetical protein